MFSALPHYFSFYRSVKASKTVLNEIFSQQLSGPGDAAYTAGFTDGWVNGPTPHRFWHPNNRTPPMFNLRLKNPSAPCSKLRDVWFCPSGSWSTGPCSTPANPVSRFMNTSKHRRRSRAAAATSKSPRPPPTSLGEQTVRDTPRAAEWEEALLTHCCSQNMTLPFIQD